MPARQAMTIELVGKEDLLTAVSLNSSAFNISRIIGPAIAGLILAASNAGICFLVNAVSFLAIIFMLIVIRPAASRTSGREESMAAQIREGLAYIRGNRLVLDVMVMTGVGGLFAFQYATLMPALARDVLHGGPGTLGALVSAAGAGALTAAVSVAALGHLFKQGKIVVLGSLIVPLGLSALAMSENLHFSIGCMVVTGFGMMLFLAVSNSLIQMMPPEHLRGRVLSVRTLVFIGFAPAGALLIGILAQYAGVRAAILAGAGVFLVTTIAIVLSSPALRSVD
jgi:MFS family permease